MPAFQTEHQKLYEAIRSAILSGEYAPGEKLPQRKLAQKFGATTITVREALRSLESEGLIMIEPKWGAMVVEITPEKIQGRYIVREALEGMAACLAARKASREEREELEALAERCDRELSGDTLSRSEKANLHYSLHERIVKVTRCEELIQAINRINLQTIILSNAYHIDWRADRPGQHGNLVRAILSGEPERAEAAMRAHIRDGYTMELKALMGRAPVA